MTLHRPFLLEVNVSLYITERIRRRYFTGKLVKRMIISANPSLKKLFEPSRGAAPKLVHITPLYTSSRGKVRTVNYVDQLKTGTYWFYVGSIDGVESNDVLPLTEAYNTLLAIPAQVSAFNTKIRVEVQNIEKIDVEDLVEQACAKLVEEGRLKLVFASPTLLRDPFVSSKHKTLVPSVFNLFSTPVYIKLYLLGRLRRRTLTKILLRLHRALTVPPTFWQTLRKIDLQYEPGRKVPALIGYLNLHYNPENDPQNTALHILKETLPYMLTLGTGVGRAAGLGHTTIHTPQAHTDGRG